MFVLVKAYMKKKTIQNSLCWCWETNLEQNSLSIFMKSMKISSKSDSLPSFSQSVVDFEQILDKFL